VGWRLGCRQRFGAIFRSSEALEVLTAHVRTVQAELDVPLALEPIATLFDWPDDE